jgi:hypothetical protein
VLAFGCELGMLAALAWSGWSLGSPTPVSVALAVVLPLAAATTWGIWCAPNARRRLTGPALTTVKLGLLVGSGVLLAAAGHPVWGGLLAVISLVDTLVLARRGRR